jgi:hypothetical protein
LSGARLYIKKAADIVQALLDTEKSEILGFPSDRFTHIKANTVIPDTYQDVAVFLFY